MTTSTLTFAKRAMSLNKAQPIVGFIMAGIGLLAYDIAPFYWFDALAVLVLIAVPFMVFGIYSIGTSLTALYVYDRNNGVLEYLISLGWNQSDIFKRYLKASLLLALILFAFELGFTMIVDLVAAPAYILTDLAWMTLIAAFGLSVVSFVNITMMAFMSLQKPVGGNANSPLALSLGALLILPTFYIQAASYSLALLVDLAIPCLVGMASIALFILSGRLIRREKMLP